MSQKILLVVDYQKDFVDGSLGFPGAERADAGIAALIREYVANEDVVFVTRDTHTKSYLGTREGKALPVPHCLFESDGWQLYGETGKVVAELQNTGYIGSLNKQTFACDGKEVIQHMPGKWRGRHAVTDILVVGLVTNICVLSNICVFQGLFPEAQITLDAALTASFDARKYLETLSVAEGLQVNVINKPKVFVEWAADNRKCSFTHDDLLTACAAAGKILVNGGDDVSLYMLPDGGWQSDTEKDACRIKVHIPGQHGCP